MNITTFEKDSHSGYSTSFKHKPLEKEVGKKSNTASNPKRIRNAQETKEDVDVTDLTLAGKSTAPAAKSRSRKGMSYGLEFKSFIWTSLMDNTLMK